MKKLLVIVFFLLASNSFASGSIVGDHTVPGGELFYLLPNNQMLSLNRNGVGGIHLTDLNTSQTVAYAENQTYHPAVLQSPLGNAIVVDIKDNYSHGDLYCTSKCIEIDFPNELRPYGNLGIRFFDTDGSLKMFFWAYDGKTGLFDHSNRSITFLLPQPRPACIYTDVRGSFAHIRECGNQIKSSIINLKTGAIVKTFSNSEMPNLSNDGRYWYVNDYTTGFVIGSNEYHFQTDQIQNKINVLLGVKNVYINDILGMHVLKSGNIILILRTNYGFFIGSLDPKTSQLSRFKLQGSRENFFWDFFYDAQLEKFYTFTGNYVNRYNLEPFNYDGEVATKIDDRSKLRVRDNLIYLKKFGSLSVFEGNFTPPPAGN